jgi:deoxyribonuclease-4
VLLGSHQSTAGGIPHAIARGEADGCDAVQIFARPSQQWAARPIDDEELSQFRSERAGVGWPALSHASYLINVCSPDPVVLARSRDALVDELERAEELGLDGVVLHPGAHMGRGERAGLALAARTFGWVGARTRGFRTRLLLELTAGQGSCLGCRIEHLEALLHDTRVGADRLGICIDTCHAHAAGYDLTSDEGYGRFVEAIDRAVGVDAVRAFHLNDSKTALGSRVDRHESIGVGKMGLLPFWRLVNDDRFATTPGVLETPPGPDGKPSFARNLAVLRGLIGAARP